MIQLADSEAPINNQLILDNLHIRVSSNEWKIDKISHQQEVTEKLLEKADKERCTINKKLDTLIELNEKQRTKKWTDIIQVITLVTIMVLSIIFGV